MEAVDEFCGNVVNFPSSGLLYPENLATSPPTPRFLVCRWCWGPRKPFRDGFCSGLGILLFCVLSHSQPRAASSGLRACARLWRQTRGETPTVERHLLLPQAQQGLVRRRLAKSGSKAWCQFFPPLGVWNRVARLFLAQTYQKTGKIYQRTTNCIKRPYIIPNGHKLYQKAVKYINIFHSMALQKISKLKFLVLK
jgi:hypothetical protein